MISRPTLYSVPGGDTVQLDETRKALELIGVNAEFKGSNEKIDYAAYDLIHFFNIIRPNVISYHLKRSNLPYVISTIFVDYSEVESKLRSFPLKLLFSLVGADGMEYIKTLARSIKNRESVLDYSYLLSGHRKSIMKVLKGASMLLPNSESEYKRLVKRYGISTNYRIVPNAVNDVFFQAGNEVQDETREGILCVARIEMIKNQLNLIRAVNQTDYPMKLIGKPAPNHLKYFEQCKKEAKEDIRFLGQLNRDEVIAEMRRSKVHVLPSYFETTGLSSLEAAACGCQIVVSPRGDTKAYFKDKAFYCEPDDIDSIKLAIEKAMRYDNDDQLKNFVSENYRWDITARKTKEAYLEVLHLNE